MNNIGTTDKVVRTIVGLAILVVGLVYDSPWGFLGFVPLITAVFGICPFYYLIGVNTCEKSTKSA